MADLMQQARELLAAEYAMAGSTKRADKIIAGFDVAPGTEYAIRAIAAALRAAPEGYVLVPVEPTDEMIEASLIRVPIAKRINPGQHLRIYGARAWDAMLAARPQGVK